MSMLQDGLVRKPICPTLIHDEATGVAICVVLIVLCLYVLFQVMVYFNKP